MNDSDFVIRPNRPTLPVAVRPAHNGSANAAAPQNHSQIQPLFPL